MSQPLKSRVPLLSSTPAPWSPLTLTVITLFLPAGAIVAARNLVRLGQLRLNGQRGLTALNYHSVIGAISLGT